MTPTSEGVAPTFSDLQSEEGKGSPVSLPSMPPSPRACPPPPPPSRGSVRAEWQAIPPQLTGGLDDMSVGESTGPGHRYAPMARPERTK